MDIHLCIERLGLSNNSYTLTSSVPPHSIAEWRGADARPTEEELVEVWAIIAAEDAPSPLSDHSPNNDELFDFLKQLQEKLGTFTQETFTLDIRQNSRIFFIYF